MSEKLNCIIPAAGSATRLHPHSQIVQKPLMLMGSPDKRLIDFSLGLSVGANKTHVITSHDNQKSELLSSYVGERAELLQDIKLMGAGSLIKFADVLFEDEIADSLIVPADHVIENLDLNNMIEYHRERSSNLTILTVPPKSYGQYITVSDGRAMHMTDSSRPGIVSSAGIYLARNKFLQDWVHAQRAQGWNDDTRIFVNDVVRPAVAAGNVSLYMMNGEGYWDDAGTPERYHANNMRLSKGDNVIDPESVVEEGAALQRVIVLGSAIVASNVELDQSILSSNGTDAFITKVGYV